MVLSSVIVPASLLIFALRIFFSFDEQFLYQISVDNENTANRSYGDDDADSETRS